MKYAQILVLPQTPPAGLTTSTGIDWASADRAVCVVDAPEQVFARFSVAHDRVGIGKLIAGLRAAGGERGRDRAQRRGAGRRSAGRGAHRGGDHLPADEGLRSRYGSVGAKDDRFDAFVLADVLRTDRSRLRSLARVCCRAPIDDT